MKKNADLSPHLINQQDEIGARLKGVFEDPTQKKHKRVQKLPFDPLDVETEMLGKSMFTLFTGLPDVPKKLAKERAARLQELLHFCSSAEATNAGNYFNLKKLKKIHQTSRFLELNEFLFTTNKKTIHDFSFISKIRCG